MSTSRERESCAASLDAATTWNRIGERALADGEVVFAESAVKNARRALATARAHVDDETLADWRETVRTIGDASDELALRVAAARSQLDADERTVDDVDVEVATSYASDYRAELAALGDSPKSARVAAAEEATLLLSSLADNASALIASDDATEQALAREAARLLFFESSPLGRVVYLARTRAALRAQYGKTPEPLDVRLAVAGLASLADDEAVELARSFEQELDA